MKKEKAKKILRFGLGIVSFLSLVLMIGTVIRVAMYVVPISDDFWYARTGIGVKGIWKRMLVACKFSYEIYVEHQGTYFTSFFGSFFNPVISGGFAAMRVIMMINAALILGSVLVLTYVYLKNAAEVDRHVMLFVMAVAVFPLTMYDSFREVFYWYVGASVYGFPMAFGIIALTLFIIYNFNKEVALTGRTPAVYATILGVFAAGASLAITGTFMYLLLCILVYFAVKRKKLELDNMIVFGICLVGAFVNALAPGNFARQGTENSGSVDIMAGISNTVGYFRYGVGWLFADKNFFVLFASLVVVGFLIYDKIKLHKVAWTVLSIMLFVAPFVTVFPVVLGYGLEWMPNRCFFIMVISMTAAFDNCAIYIGWLLGSVLKGHKKMSVLAVLTAIIFVSFIATPFTVREYCVAKLNKQLFDGEFQKNYVETKELFDSFADKKGQDVEVDVPTDPESIRNFYSFFLLDDPDSSINSDVAKAYGLNSITNTREE
ncbi:MAG: hypothetical protein J5802_03635 [Butyrivibrio sp.]|nr:hypothetical protein [Butyrivibrio sp.]